MQMSTVTRSATSPGLMLCRCFCSAYVKLTGAGLGASAIRLKPHSSEEHDNDPAE